MSAERSLKPYRRTGSVQIVISVEESNALGLAIQNLVERGEALNNTDRALIAFDARLQAAWKRKALS